MTSVPPDDSTRARKLLEDLRRLGTDDLDKHLVGIGTPEPPLYTASDYKARAGSTAKLPTSITPRLESVSIKPAALKVSLGTVSYEGGHVSYVTLTIDIQSNHLSAKKRDPQYARHKDTPMPKNLAIQIARAFSVRHARLRDRVEYVNTLRTVAYSVVSKGIGTGPHVGGQLKMKPDEIKKGNIKSDSSLVQDFRASHSTLASSIERPAKRQKTGEADTDVEELLEAIFKYGSKCQPKQEDEIPELMQAAWEADQAFAVLGSESQTLTLAMQRMNRALKAVVEKRLEKEQEKAEE